MHFKYFSSASAVALVALVSTTPARADLQTYHADFVVTDLGGSDGAVNDSSVVVGDTFYFQFTLDDSVVDTGGFFAHFPDLYTSFLLGRAPDNTGTWDPLAGGAWSVPADGDAGSADTAVIFNGTGFAGVSLSSDSPEEDSAIATSVIFNPDFYQGHAGSTETFAQMFGTLDPSGINSVLFFEGEGSQGEIDAAVSGDTVNFGAGPSPELELTPEPSATALLGGTLGVGGWFLRRRKLGRR